MLREYQKGKLGWRNIWTQNLSRTPFRGRWLNRQSFPASRRSLKEFVDGKAAAGFAHGMNVSVISCVAISKCFMEGKAFPTSRCVWESWGSGRRWDNQTIRNKRSWTVAGRVRGPGQHDYDIGMTSNKGESAEFSPASIECPHWLSKTMSRDEAGCRTLRRTMKRTLKAMITW